MVEPMTEARSTSHTSRAFAVVATIGAASGITACDDAREPLPDWSAGYSTAPNEFALVLPDSVTWPARLGRKDAMNEPCTYKPSDWPNPVDCILDVNELDLWVKGLKYDIVMPPRTCDFVLHSPYIFANFPYGPGPTRVSYTVDIDGGHRNEVIAPDGNPACAVDHGRAAEDLPNCCVGAYTLVVTNAADGGVTSSSEHWGRDGGKIGDCFYGAGYVEEGAAFSPSGLPMERFLEVDGGNRFPIVYSGLSDKYPANVPLANYFDPRDHGGTEPLGLTKLLRYGTPIDYQPPFPGYEPTWPHGEAPPRPYYEAFCLSHSEGIRAHIRLTVREWNEEAQFGADGGSPETGRDRQREPGWDAGPYWLDDIPDWATLTPSNTTYPRLKVNRSGS